MDVTNIIKKIMRLRRPSQLIYMYWTLPMVLAVFHCPYQLPWIACDFCSILWCPSKYMQKPIFYSIAGTSLVSGRFFCGWLCPIGTCQDAINKASRRFSGRDVRLPDKPLARYGILAITLTIIAGIIYSINIPHMKFIPATLDYFPLLLALIILLSAFVYRFWCRFLCPLGAFTSLFNKISLIRPRIKGECNGCGKCTVECVMTQVDKTHPDSPDCIRCMECLPRCPKDLVRVHTI